MIASAARWFCIAMLSCLPLSHAGDFVGRNSCGSATCHGGLVDRGPAWHSSDSVWMANDPHALAGNVLFNKLSMRIVTALEPRAAQSQEVFDQLLIDRCASCHAPSASPPQFKANSGNKHEELGRRLAEGVSCEACHGAASGWLQAHTLTSWDQKGAARFSSPYDMKDTESVASRTENCAGCHVGSRTQDGLIRDMNHDMIAAGHPALHFNMWQSHGRLHAHWDPRKERLSSASNETAADLYAQLRKQVLASATRLSEERQAFTSSSQGDFVPELSEFDCAACHHVLATNSPRLARGSTGLALWHPWYTAGQLAPAVRNALHINTEKFSEQIRSMRAQLDTNPSNAQSNPASATIVDSASRLRQLVSSNPFDNSTDYCTLPVWFDELGALIPKSSLPEDVRNRLAQTVCRTRNELLPVAEDWCESKSDSKSQSRVMSRLMPTPCNALQVDPARRQFLEIIGLTAKGPTANGAQP